MTSGRPEDERARSKRHASVRSIWGRAAVGDERSSSRLDRLRQTELWTARLRVFGVALGAVEVGLLDHPYPHRYEAAAWLVTFWFAVGSLVLLLGCRVVRTRTGLKRIGASALVFDTVVAYGYMTVFAFEPGVVSWGLVYLPVIEAAVRYGLAGGLAASALSLPLLAAVEWWRSSRFLPGGFDGDLLLLPAALAGFTGLVVGYLVNRLAAEQRKAFARAREAETLRDELGRRADLVDAANRCARALGSSLVLETAFEAFLAELGNLVPYDRVTIVLHDGGQARVMATAGLGADSVFPTGATRPYDGTLLEQVVTSGEPHYQPQLSEGRYPADTAFHELGLGCRLAAPLVAADRPIGMVSLARVEVASFSPAEVELVGLLGRFVGSAVQNIRAYEELRNLSALRADFVSIVSHELRSPLTAVIGSARMLRDRGEGLAPEQRRSLLELIVKETSRLGTLIADVLDASRIDAGTFDYTFGEVAVEELVQESAAAIAAAASDVVPVEARVYAPLPRVRGDRERLRQVLANLLENAVRYSPEGVSVVVSARSRDGKVLVDVADGGPGIPLDQQQAIFEKFGRATGHEAAKPGTGLGLFIARSIAEAHGGTLDVQSAPGAGAVFTLSLPIQPV